MLAIKNPPGKEPLHEEEPSRASIASVPPRSHKERFRASLTWALDEWSSTLEKLAK